MVDRVFKTILLFTPIAYCVGVGAYKFELIFFQMASVILFISTMFDNQKRQPQGKALIGLFLGLCLLSVYLHGFQLRNLSALINILIGCFDIYIVSAYVRDINKCANWLLIGIGLNTLVFIGQILGYSPFIDPNTFTGSAGEVIKGEFGGIIGNAPRFAMFIALVLPFVSRLYIIPALIIGIYLQEVSVFFSAYVTLMMKSDWRLSSVVFFSGLVAVGVFYQKIFHSITIRLPIWRQIVDLLAHSPIKGYGLGRFDLADYAMSSFLQWIYGVGFLGIGFFILCIRKIKWYLIPLFFLCLFEYPFEVPRLWIVIVFCIAFYAIKEGGDYVT